MYSLLRSALFQLDPETAHHLTLRSLSTANALGIGCLAPSRPADDPRTVMGLTFPNPLGLAAGLDKNGECIDGLAALGFGHIEIGTVTPQPQPGNPKPRLFRIPQANAIINRMGFNNDGVDKLVENVKHAQYRGILGINIGKNALTPIEKAADDYLICMRKVYPCAGYVTVNISSPNTKNLRDLQGGDALDVLLRILKQERRQLADKHGKYVPLVVKIAPDLDSEQIKQIARLLIAHHIDGVIATNTTVDKAGLEHPHAKEQGGLSGAPLRAPSTQMIAEIYRLTGGKLPIVGVGGIMTPDDAAEKLDAGATLVQIYTGLIYAGPGLAKQIVEAL